jgi:hypothetical protein
VPRGNLATRPAPRAGYLGLGSDRVTAMSGRGLVCAIAPRPTKSGIARPHQNLVGGPGNFARIAPKKRPIIVKFYTLIEFIEAHILVI